MAGKQESARVDHGSKKKEEFTSWLRRYFPTWKDWWIRYWRAGEQIRESTFSENEEDAFTLLSKRNMERPRSKAQRPQDTLIASLLPLVEADYKKTEQRSIVDVKARTRLHLMPFFGQMVASKLTSTDVEAYKEKRLSTPGKNPVQKATVNRELAILRRAYQLGFDHEPPMVSVIPKIKKFPTKQERIRTGFLEDAQYRALLAALPEELKMLLVYGYHTGIRKGELLSIRLDQVNWRAKQITLYHGTTKSNEGRVLPIYGEMIPWTEMALDDLKLNYPDCQWLFHRAGRHIKDFRKAWENACEAAGVDASLFHDLRRCAVRNMEFAGVPRTVARAITGHKTESVYLRYMIVPERDIRDAGEKLARHIESARLADLSEPGTEPAQRPAQDRKFKGGEKAC